MYGLCEALDDELMSSDLLRAGGQKRLTHDERDWVKWLGSILE